MVCMVWCSTANGPGRGNRVESSRVDHSIPFPPFPIQRQSVKIEIKKINSPQLPQKQINVHTVPIHSLLPPPFLPTVAAVVVAVAIPPAPTTSPSPPPSHYSSPSAPASASLPTPLRADLAPTSRRRLNARGSRLRGVWRGRGRRRGG